MVLPILDRLPAPKDDITTAHLVHSAEQDVNPVQRQNVRSVRKDSIHGERPAMPAALPLTVLLPASQHRCLVIPVLIKQALIPVRHARLTVFARPAACSPQNLGLSLDALTVIIRVITPVIPVLPAALLVLAPEQGVLLAIQTLILVHLPVMDVHPACLARAAAQLMIFLAPLGTSKARRQPVLYARPML